MLEAASIPHHVTGGLLLARIFEEAGLPPGVLSVVVGSGSDIGDAIVSHPVPSVVSFTGSTAVGEGIAKTAGIKRPSLELGGNGPLVVQLSSVRDKVERAVSGGARHVLGGEPTGPAGLLLPPHVLLGEKGVATAKEEVFGPVITIIPAASEQDALEIANDTDYGLSSAVFTRNAERGVAFALSVQAGMTHVNDSPVNDDTNTAFGGVKASGIGRFGGHWVIEEFTTHHWVSVQREPRSLPIPLPGNEQLQHGPVAANAN